jgi:uncharacterized cupredoxin-like copper-binding protein
LLVVAAIALVTVGLAGCGDDGNDTSETTRPPTTATKSEAVSITARDYAFDLPSTITGGAVSLAFTNQGKEPHFAGIVRIAAGRSLDDVKTFFSSPPSGPPPFEEIGGLATAEPGASGNQTLELEPGSYALFCAIQSPDGVPHVAKGMLAGFTVTPGGGALPAAADVITAKDFSFSALPRFKAGDNVVKLENSGTQLHEVNLVALETGKTVDDLVAFLTKPQGPPPAHFLSGAAVRPGAATTTRLTLTRGTTYVLICAIPDQTDGVPHVAKGMATATFTVS